MDFSIYNKQIINYGTQITSTPFISANVLDEFIIHSMYETKQPRNCQKDTALSEAIT